MKPFVAVPATMALVYRAWSHKSLTPGGIFAAVLTAAAHAYHPSNLPFALLCIFFLLGTRVTKVKKDVKASLTIPSKGSSGGEGPRNHVQVFSNSLVASVLSITHAYLLNQRSQTLDNSTSKTTGAECYPWGGDLLIIGIIANYAAVAADTFSSELGILSKSQPRLIISPTLRKVPAGTNGGVTLVGTLAGLLGSILISASSMLFLPACVESSHGVAEGAAWTLKRRMVFVAGMSFWGLLGSVLDSILGGLFQRTVKDSRTGKVVEGEGGVRVLISNEETHEALLPLEAAVLSGEGARAVEHTDPTLSTNYVESDEKDLGKDKYDVKTKHRRPSFGDRRPTRVVESGLDLLDNNEINLLMAATMSVGAMAMAGYLWDIPMRSILNP